MAPVLRLMRRMPQVVGPLQIQPEFWCRVKRLRQPQGHIWRHRPLLMQDLGEALPRHSERCRGLGDANAKGLQVVP